jgi:hypothetical protein
MEDDTRSIPPSDVPLAAPPVAASPPLWSQVLRVAWLSIGLGLLLEIVLLVLAAYLDAAGDSPKPFVSDLAQKISWGFIVCVGIAFGSTAGKAREAAMGVLGLISAPAGFAIARAVHKGVSQALSLAAAPGAEGVAPLVVGGLKGLEYAVLGAAIGWVGKKAWGGLGAHAATGALIGVVFGSAILGYSEWSTLHQTPLVLWLSRGVNEFLFPVGCSLVLYASGAMAKRLE